MYKKLKKLLKFPINFTFKIICLNKKNMKKKILKIIKKKLLKIKKKNINFSKNKKYFSYSITIYFKKFKDIKYIYKKIGKLKFVKIVF
ncbi:DUF493 family protein [Buchnera aphidicola (Periphyllus koelreuteriae)]|uniref:DUF493 family protein n=1 Tax=Buchnera aphidicola TaxID=9 RepID=UPI0031B8853C